MIYVEPTAKFGADEREVGWLMRDEDRDELWELGRTTPLEAVEQSIETSTEAYVAYDEEGTPIAVFGALTSVLGDVGVPWLLGTRGVDDHAREYMQLGRKFSAHMLTTCASLENVALARNRRSLVFLSRMGFDIGRPFKTLTGVEAVRFTMEK
ncbi:acetyltransferase [Octadecabacter Antarctic BD virus 1]|nr:acetyltransferase [Octadecabacter Antarctic BD virus 1]